MGAAPIRFGLVMLALVLSIASGLYWLWVPVTIGCMIWTAAEG